MKIAICFSGQLRTGVEAAPNILRYIGDLLPNCDFFVHTWDVESYSNVGFSSRMTDDKCIPPGQLYPININTYHEFVKIYTPVISMLHKYSLSARTISNNGRKVYLPHQYSVYKSNELKCIYENTENFKYDVVIRVRPDIIFDESKSLITDIHAISTDRTLCYAQLHDGPVMNNQIDNAYWLGCSYVLDQVSSFHNIMANISPLKAMDEHIHFGNWVTEGLLFDTVKLENSKVGIYRQHHKERNVSPFDYNYITRTLDRHHPH